MGDLQPTPAMLRPALQFALDNSRSATRYALPGPVRALVRARRLPPTWRSIMLRALEDDPRFREAVAAEAEEEDLGRLAWLWLARPAGWAVELAEMVQVAVAADEEVQEQARTRDRVSALEAELAGARDELAGARSTIGTLNAEIEEARKVASDLDLELRRARSRLAETRAELTLSQDRIAELSAAQSDAARRAEVLGQELARAKKGWAEAQREAERARAAERWAGERPVGAGSADASGPSGGSAGAAGRVEREVAAAGRVEREVAAAAAAGAERVRRRATEPIERAAAAAAELGRALAEAAAALGAGDGPGAADAAGMSGAAGAVSGMGAGAAESARSAGRAVIRSGVPSGDRPGDPMGHPPGDPPARPGPVVRRRMRPPSRPRPVRRPAALPPAVFAESVEAAAHLVRLPGSHLIVDGYNVTLTSWSGPRLADLRHRLLSALSELVVRVKHPVTVVFDGTDDGNHVAAPPVARPWLRIVFTSSSVEADEVIVDYARRLPQELSVVVATNDREVRADAAALGANVISVDQLLAVLGRTPDPRA